MINKQTYVALVRRKLPVYVIKIDEIRKRGVREWAMWNVVKIGSKQAILWAGNENLVKTLENKLDATVVLTDVIVLREGMEVIALTDNEGMRSPTDGEIKRGAFKVWTLKIKKL